MSKTRVIKLIYSKMEMTKMSFSKNVFLDKYGVGD